MKPLHHIAAIAALVAATFGADNAAAAPASANPLSSYIGQCVAFFTTDADLGSAFGLLRAAEDECTSSWSCSAPVIQRSFTCLT